MSSHCFIFDPIPFSGGSKVATDSALSLCRPERTEFTVLTAHPESWESALLSEKHTLALYRLPSPAWLARANQGWLFWLKQGWFALFILLTLTRASRVHTAVGASGPGIDMALYLCQPLFRYKLVQLVHGPVAASRSIGACLTKADFVFYLTSSTMTLSQCLQNYLGHDLAWTALIRRVSGHWQSFDNGLHQHGWPTACQTERPELFWAASLLKWKGLDQLVSALSPLSLVSNICFIRPCNTRLPVSDAPVALGGARWYEEPDDLDRIRAQSSIFISTSTNEPFGLSILEAMAAGMCVIIPSDGAYWDQVLTHDYNCLKYEPQNESSLQTAILKASSDMSVVRQLGRKARLMASNYQAHKCYAGIVCCVEGNGQHAAEPGVQSGEQDHA